MRVFSGPLQLVRKGQVCGGGGGAGLDNASAGSVLCLVSRESCLAFSPGWEHHHKNTSKSYFLGDVAKTKLRLGKRVSYKVCRSEDYIKFF